MKITAWILVILATSSPAFADGLQYNITLLSLPPNSSEASPSSLSSAGVSGSSFIGDWNQPGGYSQPTFWEGTQPTLLPIPLGYMGGGIAINNAGDIAGYIRALDSGYPQPALWHAGQLQLLDTLGLSNGAAYSVNDAGVAVGEVDGGISGPEYAVMWNNGHATILSNSGIALAINNAGQVLVSGTNSSIWSADNSTPITQPAGTQFFVPRYLNDQGHVAGNMTPTQDNSASYGFLWEDGTTIQLPNLPSDTLSFPQALNNSDQIVGYDASTGPAAGMHAVLWQNDQVFDLNTLIPANSGWTLSDATGINDAGQIG